jgi:hypothetical protein
MQRTVQISEHMWKNDPDPHIYRQIRYEGSHETRYRVIIVLTTNMEMNAARRPSTA